MWSALYLLIAISFGFVFLNVIRRRWPPTIALPFAINLVANLVYTPLQFGLRNNALALLDIIIVLATIAWMIKVVWPRARWIAWMQVSYALWVAFASMLQASITWLNW